MVEVKSKQHLDIALMELKELVLGKLNESFSLVGDGVLTFQKRVCVPDIDGLRDRILVEERGSRDSIH